jgi:hypothetical protein
LAAQRAGEAPAVSIIVFGDQDDGGKAGKDAAHGIVPPLFFPIKSQANPILLSFRLIWLEKVGRGENPDRPEPMFGNC